jgi:hypothetical protein
MQALIFRFLKRGGKYSAFDQHQQFLEEVHRFREDNKQFMEDRVVHEIKEIHKFKGIYSKL